MPSALALSLLRRLRLPALAATLLAPLAAATLQTVIAPGAPNYTLRTWQAEDGLPQNSVTAIAQTTDGFLWLGSYGGIARFDGVRFETFNCANTPELPDARIVSLLATPDGVLWIGHESGALSRFAHGVFSTGSSSSAHRNTAVVGLAADERGEIWMLRSNGVLEARSSGRTLRLPNSSAAPNPLNLFSTPDGQIHVEFDGRIARLVQDSLEVLDFGIARRGDYVLRSGPARQQGFWVVRDWRIQKWSGGTLLRSLATCPWPAEAHLSCLRELADGSVAVGTMEHGLYLVRADGTSRHFDRTVGLPQDWIRAIAEDREGNLWLGTGTGGVSQLASSRFRSIGGPPAWQTRSTLPVHIAAGNVLWVSVEGAGVFRLADDELTTYPAEEFPDLRYVWSIAQKPDGAVWMGTWSSGLLRQTDLGFEPVAAFDPVDGPVLALQYLPEDRALWIGCGAGLMRWPDGPATRPERIGGGGTVCTFVRDRDGTLWYGLLNGGLGAYASGVHRRYGRAEGFPSNSAQSLCADPDGTLWVGTTDSGLVRCRDGRFAAIGTAQGLPSDTVCHIVDDRAGHLWLSTQHGIVRLAKAELHRCADGLQPSVDALSFDRFDGLPANEFSGELHAAGCRSEDGRLLFSSTKGVVAFDPAALPIDEQPPSVIVEHLQVDDRRLALAVAPPADLVLEPTHRRLTFDYTAPCLTAPEKVRFRHRLEGVDDHWIEAGTKRSVNYSRLSAGTYEFSVLACNGDGRWAPVAASFRFAVRPFFWQSWWFLALSAGLVLGAAVHLARRLAVRRLHRRYEALEHRHAVERERTRIAQDIHDEIGSSLTRIMMLSQCGAPESGAPEAPPSPLRRIYNTALGVTAALDEIVWAVNPRHDSLESLVSYMIGEFAQSLLAEAGLRCRLDLPLDLPDWPLSAEVRHNLFLAFKEALNNAIRHAGASEVRIALELQADRFSLVISDDGSGFDTLAPTATRSADGLANMRRRLVHIGGRCEIVSRVGHGTRIAFTVDRRPSPSTRTP